MLPWLHALALARALLHVWEVEKYEEPIQTKIMTSQIRKKLREISVPLSVTSWQARSPTSAMGWGHVPLRTAPHLRRPSQRLACLMKTRTHEREHEVEETNRIFVQYYGDLLQKKRSSSDCFHRLKFRVYTRPFTDIKPFRYHSTCTSLQIL